MPELIFRRWIQKKCFHVGFLLCFLFLGGCDNLIETELSYANYSDVEVEFKITGVSPDVAPSSLQPGDGLDSLSAVGTYIFDPVHFDDTIKITWTIGEDETKHEQEFKRDDLGIPAVVNGCTIKFTYTKAGVWEINYSK